MAYANDPELRRCGRFTYSLNSSLGKGTFAEVFLGHDERNAPVAIKRISRTRLKKPSAQRLLDSEIAIMKKLRHPNVVILLDVLETSDEICLVMEYCDGGDLAEYIKAHAGMNEITIANIAKQLSAALTYLRELNIVHRDLKPHNMLIKKHEDGSFTLKLADFGFARQLVADEMAATFCGSPLYMAPEVLQGAKYSAKAELWSVGTILYSCLTGHTPYKATSMLALRQLLRKPNLKLDIPARASPALGHLLLRLLQISPKKRADFEEFAHHQFLTGEPLSALELKDTENASYNQPDPDPLADLDQDIEDESSSSYVVVDDIQVQLNIMTDAARGNHFEPSRPQNLVSRWTAALLPGGRDRPSRRATSPQLRQLADRIAQVLSPAMAIIAFAEKRYPSLKASSTEPIDPNAVSRDHCHALVLYAKALHIFRAGLRTMRHAVQDHPQWMRDTEVKASINTLKQQFGKCISASNRLREAGVAQAFQRFTQLQTAEQLLYEHALSLCRVAAEDEKAGLLSASAEYYREAVVLLRVVAEAAPDKDRIVLEDYIRMAEERRGLVIATLDTETSSSKPAYGPEGSMANSLTIAQEVQAAQTELESPQRISPRALAAQQHPQQQHPVAPRMSPLPSGAFQGYHGSPPDPAYRLGPPTGPMYHPSPPDQGFGAYGASPPYGALHPAQQVQYLAQHQQHGMYSSPHHMSLSPPNAQGYGYAPQNALPPYPSPGMIYSPHLQPYGYTYPAPPMQGYGSVSSHSTTSMPGSVVECPHCHHQVAASPFCSQCGQPLAMSTSASIGTSAQATGQVSIVKAEVEPRVPSDVDDDATPQGSPERKANLGD